MSRSAYMPDVCPFAESEIARPAWMTEMIRKWMYNPPELPLRQWLHSSRANGFISGVMYKRDVAKEDDEREMENDSSQHPDAVRVTSPPLNMGQCSADRR